MKASNFFRPVPVESPVHRLRAETKVMSGILISIGLVFNPYWTHVGFAAILLLVTFIAARLPVSVLPRIPQLARYALLGGTIGAASSGGDPTVAGFGIGGLLDYGRLVAVGFIMILWAGVLNWTTGLTSIGFALRRLVLPLRRLGLPVDEWATGIALTVRALPLVIDEVEIVSETLASRPIEADHRGNPIRETLGLIGDTATAIVVGSHRRARDLAMAMTSRGSELAPAPPKQPVTRADILILLSACVLCLASFLISGLPALGA